MYRIQKTTVKQVYAENRRYKLELPLTICHAYTWMDYCQAARDHAKPDWLNGVNKAIRDSIKPNKAFAEQVTHMRQKVRLGISKHHQVAQWHYDVTGSTAIDFGAAFAGIPECILRRHKEHSYKTVRILYSPEVQADTSPKAIILRGAVLAELCDLLARHQIRTEIITGFDTQYKKCFYESWVRIKAINAPLNLSALWFPFQSNEFLNILERQLIFHPQILDSHSMAGSSGMTCPADIVIATGATDETSQHFSSLEKAIAWASDLFEAIRDGRLTSPKVWK